MPQAGDEEHDEDIQAGAAFPLPAAPQGEVEVILKPAGKADVPPPPELFDGLGEVGAVEVLHQLEAQHFGGAPGDVGIGGEVAVDLEGEGRCGHQEGAPALALGGVVDGVHQHRQVVGDDHLLEQAPHHRGHPRPQVLVPEGVVLLELVEDVPRPLDGPGHQLGEEGDEQGVVEEVPLGGHVLPVHVDGVAQGLEGVKGDAHRQQHVQQGHVHGKAQIVQPPGEHVRGEVVVLEEEQHPQVQHQAQGHPQPALAPHGTAHQQAAAVGDGGGEEHQKGVDGVPAHVEVVAGQQQLEVPGPAGQQVVEGHVHRQEHQVLDGVEIHGCSLLTAWRRR